MVGEWDVVAQAWSAAGEAETRADPGMAARHCPTCGGGKLVQWGYSERGVPRLRCGVCERSFAALHGTVLAGLHDIAAFRLVLDDMMSEVHSSCRALAARLGLDKSTVWRWRKRINAALALGDRERVRRLVGDDVVRLRESRKASREWVRHRQDPARFPAPDRPRWVDVDSRRLPAPTPLARFLVSVAVAQDESGREIARVLPVGALATAGEDMRAAARDCVPTSAPATAGTSRSEESLFKPVPRRSPAAAAAASSTDAAAASRAAVSHHSAGGLRDRFWAFIHPFRGPATRHLEGYAAWFTIGADNSKERRLARAWTLLLRHSPTEFADIPGCRAELAGAGVTDRWATGG